MSHIAKIAVSDLLERTASDEEKNNGYDLADYLIQFDALQVSQKVLPEQKQTFQTVGDFFDLLKANGYEKLPTNCLGVNAGIWQTQIN